MGRTGPKPWKTQGLKPQELLTAHDVAKRFDVTVNTAYAWFRDGRIQLYQLPGRDNSRKYTTESAIYEWAKEWNGLTENGTSL